MQMHKSIVQFLYFKYSYKKKVLNMNPVPAAAVIQEGQALFGMIGRKGHLGGIHFLYNKIKN